MTILLPLTTFTHHIPEKAVKWSTAVIQGPLQSYKVTETDANDYECLMITWLVRCLREFAMQTSEMCDFHQFTHDSFIWSHHKGALPCNVTYVSKKLLHGSTFILLCMVPACDGQTSRQTDGAADSYATHMTVYVNPKLLHCGSKKTRQLWRTVTTTQFSRF